MRQGDGRACRRRRAWADGAGGLASAWTPRGMKARYQDVQERCPADAVDQTLVNQNSIECGADAFRPPPLPAARMQEFLQYELDYS
jgi:hypothetical protein